MKALTTNDTFTFQASDEDFDPNSVISHFVVGGDGADMFHVEPESGHVRVACSMIDKEGSKFTLQVSASDGERTSTNPATVDVSASLLMEPRIFITKVNLIRFTELDLIHLRKVLNFCTAALDREFRYDHWLGLSSEEAI